MSHLNKCIFTQLPEEVESYILWLSTGANNLDTYTKKKAVNCEIALYGAKSSTSICGFYLKPIDNYSKIKELEDMEYLSVIRWLLADFGISKSDYIYHISRSKKLKYK
tara:strand:- start:2849 stop:3172 length:324 start_codon:yes stop_codon:yes gene_type:complete